MAGIIHWSFDEADLAASLDDTMNGVGAEVGSMFNMRDALSALPLCDDEVELLCNNKPLPGHDTINPDHSETESLRSCSMSAPFSTSFLFDNVLKAPTSPATRFSEDSLTYLNQGQVYELKLRWNILKSSFIKSIIRVCFHDRQMEMREREHWFNWHQTHPGERVLDLDFDKSYQYEDLTIDPVSTNRFVCFWNSVECGIALRFNCISTEFTARKHGGEKGVPFRLQVDHYEVERNKHLESYACQIKVFKMKGADRKHKTEREKIERKSTEGKAIYKPSSPVTRLSFLPLRRADVQHQFSQSSKQFVSPSTLSIHSDAYQVILLPATKADSFTQTVQSTQPEKITDDSDIHQRTNPLFNVADVSSPCPSVETINSFSLDRTGSEFVTPAQPCQRSRISLIRSSSPGPPPSPSPNRRLSGTLQSCQRRRRQRTSDNCVGTCSSCGRSCRSSIARWVRGSKNRIICPSWDSSISRTKQATWVSEKRKASQFYDNASFLSESGETGVLHVKTSILNCEEGNNAEHLPGRTCELSTSAESSLGNDELSKWTLIDKYDDEHSANPIQIDRDPMLAMSSATSSSRDGGYCSEIQVKTDAFDLEDRVLKQLDSFVEQQSSSKFDLHVDNSLLSSVLESDNSGPSCEPSTTVTCRGVDVQGPKSVGHVAGTTCVIDSEMTTQQVTDWLRRSNFENLVETFQNFRGSDMMRLTKDDFLSLCGPFEGLRLFNAFSNKPTRPRCTLFVCLRGQLVYHAVMLYELTQNELVRRIASIILSRPDQIKMLCILTANEVPVLVTDELIAQFKDQSCYQIIIGWSCGNKANVCLKPV